MLLRSGFECTHSKKNRSSIMTTKHYLYILGTSFVFFNILIQLQMIMVQ